MKKIDETPIIYTKTNTNQKKCDLVEDLGGNRYQLCREPQKTITTGFNKPSKPTFVVDSIDMFNNKPVEIKQFYNPSPLDYSPYNSLPTSYQPTPQQSVQLYPSNLPFEIDMDFENKEFMRLGPEKYQSRSYVLSALCKIKQGELNTSSPFPPITDITLEHLRNGIEEAIKSTDGIVEASEYALIFSIRGALFGASIGITLKGNPYVIGSFTVLGGIIGAITGGLVGLKEVGVYGGAEVVGEVIKAQEILKNQEPVSQKKNETLNQNTLIQKKEIIQTQQVTPPQKQVIQQVIQPQIVQPQKQVVQQVIQSPTKPLTQTDKERLAVNPRLGIRYDKNGNSMEDFIKSWHEAKNQTTIEPTEETQKIRDQLVHELHMAGVRKEPESVKEAIREKIRQIPIYRGPIKSQVEQLPSNANNTNRSKKDECIIF
jgi:hypothetical protein